MTLPCMGTTTPSSTMAPSSGFSMETTGGCVTCAIVLSVQAARSGRRKRARMGHLGAATGPRVYDGSVAVGVAPLVLVVGLVALVDGRVPVAVVVDDHLEAARA